MIRASRPVGADHHNFDERAGECKAVATPNATLFI
jgi:hypothetical protein